MVASTLATGLYGTTILNGGLGLGLGGIAPIGYGLGGLAPINSLGWNRGLVGTTVLNRGLVAPAPYGLGLGWNGLAYNGLGLRANSLLLPQSRIISAPLVAPLTKTVLWK